MSEDLSQFPNTAKRYFIELYLRKIKKRKNVSPTLQRTRELRAARCWHSLTEVEKQKFEEQFKIFETRYREKFANQLKDFNPRDTRNKTNNADCAENEVNISASSTNDPIFNHEELHTDITVGDQDERFCSNEINQLSHDDHDSTHIYNKSMSDTLAVPTSVAPQLSVKNGRDLFELVKSSSDDYQPEQWIGLSNEEKRPYQDAATYLKKEYIQNYKFYLQTLSSRELYDLLAEIE